MGMRRCRTIVVKAKKQRILVSEVRPMPLNHKQLGL